mgnify:CR=1 FL=1
MAVRRTNPPIRIKVNKAGAVSLWSWTRRFMLPDDVTFDVDAKEESGKVVIVLSTTK